MSHNSTDFHTKQQRSKESALVVLATTPNYKKAAETLGISRELIYEWLKDPIFKAELEKLRNEILNDSISKMKGYISDSVDTLASLLTDENSQVRRGAANDILNHVGRFVELQELEKRIVILEGRNGAGR